MFWRYYKGHRHCWGGPLDDAERPLGKLKVECGHKFTQRLGGRSAGAMEGYQRHLEGTTSERKTDIATAAEACDVTQSLRLSKSITKPQGSRFSITAPPATNLQHNSLARGAEF